MYSYKSIVLTLLSGWALFMTQTIIAAGGTEKAEQSQLQFHVVFNNVPYKAHRYTQIPDFRISFCA